MSGISMAALLESARPNLASVPEVLAKLLAPDDRHVYIFTGGQTIDDRTVKGDEQAKQRLAELRARGITATARQVPLQAFF